MMKFSDLSNCVGGVTMLRNEKKKKWEPHILVSFGFVRVLVPLKHSSTDVKKSAKYKNCSSQELISVRDSSEYTERALKVRLKGE